MFLGIANHLWQSTLFAAAIVILSRLLRSNGAHVRYWLWWAASLKFLVPFSLLTTVGTWLAPQASFTPASEAWINTITVVARPFAGNGGTSVAIAILLSIWAGGTLIVLAAWVLRAWRLRRILVRATRDLVPLASGATQVPVYRTDAQTEPGVVGILRMALLLPAELESKLGRDQLEAVVAHELCHIRRRDNLTAAVHMVVEAAFWFYPLVWWIGARLVDERERACDEMVVALGHDRRTYAESILDVCEHFAALRLPCAAGISGSDLKRRVTQIMSHRKERSLRLSKKLLLGLTALVSLAIPIAAGLMVQRTVLAQETVPQSNAAESTNREAQRSPTEPGTPRFPDYLGNSGEYLPIFKAAPVYPPNALARGLEGFVIVQYTVEPDGTTQNVKAIESSSELFNQVAIDSAKKYKYKPRYVNGQPEAVDGVTTKIVFTLEGEDDIVVDPTAQADVTQGETGEGSDPVIIHGGK